MGVQLIRMHFIVTPLTCVAQAGRTAVHLSHEKYCSPARCWPRRPGSASLRSCRPEAERRPGQTRWAVAVIPGGGPHGPAHRVPAARRRRPSRPGRRGALHPASSGRRWRAGRVRPAAGRRSRWLSRCCSTWRLGLGKKARWDASLPAPGHEDRSRIRRRTTAGSADWAAAPVRRYWVQAGDPVSSRRHDLELAGAGPRRASPAPGAVQRLGADTRPRG